MAGVRSIGVLVVVVFLLVAFLPSESVEALTLGGNILRVRRWCHVSEVILQLLT